LFVPDGATGRAVQRGEEGVERLKTIAAATFALVAAYWVLKIVGWILGFTIRFVLEVGFLVLLVIVAVPIYLVVRKKLG